MIVACIPAFNEEKAIAGVVRKARRFVDTVVVCDDGSSDNTAAIAESFGAIIVKHSRNMGKGTALVNLFETSRKLGAKAIVTLDGDGQHDPSDIPNVLRPVLEGSADISVGVRFNGNNQEFIPSYRIIGNRLVTILANFGSDSPVSDTTCGFRAYSRRAVEGIRIFTRGMGVDSQILMDARRKRFRIKEAQVSVRYGADTSTLNPVQHFMELVTAIVSYRVRTALPRPLPFEILTRHHRIPRR